MKIIYDPETDSLTITLRQDRIKESDEVRPGVIADFGMMAAWSGWKSCRLQGSAEHPGDSIRHKCLRLRMAGTAPEMKDGAG